MSRGLVSTAFADVFLWPRLLYPVLIRDWESLRRLASHRHDGTCHGGGARLAAGRRPSLTCPPETHTCAHAPLGQGQLAARTMKSKCLVVFRAWVICWFFTTDFQQRREFWRIALEHPWLVWPSVSLDMQNSPFTTLFCPQTHAQHVKCSAHTSCVKETGQVKQTPTGTTV